MQIDIEIELATRTTFDLIIDSKIDLIDVDLNEFNREKINFEFFETDIEFEFATRKTFD